MKIRLRKWIFFFLPRNFFTWTLISKMAVKMNLRIITKNHAADPEIGFLAKSISKPNGWATAMSTAWELIVNKFVFYLNYCNPTWPKVFEVRSLQARKPSLKIGSCKKFINDRKTFDHSSFDSLFIYKNRLSWVKLETRAHSRLNSIYKKIVYLIFILFFRILSLFV